MARKDIYEFAVKWSEKFREPDISYIELADYYLADDFSSLGFEMDCGEAFEEKYGRAVCDAKTLDSIIENIDDIALLGSAIYSRWRYFNHWAHDAVDILSESNRSWFIIALNRLIELSKEDSK